MGLTRREIISSSRYFHRLLLLGHFKPVAPQQYAAAIPPCLLQGFPRFLRPVTLSLPVLRYSIRLGRPPGLLTLGFRLSVRLILLTVTHAQSNLFSNYWVHNGEIVIEVFRYFVFSYFIVFFFVFFSVIFFDIFFSDTRLVRKKQLVWRELYIM